MFLSNILGKLLKKMKYPNTFFAFIFLILIFFFYIFLNISH